MKKQEIEKLKKDFEILKIKYRKAKRFSTMYEIEKRMIEISRALNKELKTCMW